jgi:hypothetical protein
MKKDCECKYCQNQVNEYFCIYCGFNYNECESYFEYKEKTDGNLPVLGISLCPNCLPQEIETNNIRNIFRKLGNT